jgi:hypothetical protein
VETGARWIALAYPGFPSNCYSGPRKGTYWSKKVETLNGSDFALSFSNSSFSLRECFAHALTVGWEALDESASNELLNFALTIG